MCCTPDELKAMKAGNPQWGVDLCVDCSGNGPAIQSSMELLRPGGTLCIFGVAAPETRVRSVAQPCPEQSILFVTVI